MRQLNQIAARADSAMLRNDGNGPGINKLFKIPDQINRNPGISLRQSIQANNHSRENILGPNRISHADSVTFYKIFLQFKKLVSSNDIGSHRTKPRINSIYNPPAHFFFQKPSGLPNRVLNLVRNPDQRPLPISKNERTHLIQKKLLAIQNHLRFVAIGFRIFFRIKVCHLTLLYHDPALLPNTKNHPASKKTRGWLFTALNNEMRFFE